MTIKEIGTYIILLLILFMNGCRPSSSGQIKAKEVSKNTITIDGKLNDWPAADPVVVHDRELFQGDLERKLSDNTMACRSVWNQNYLYLAFEVEDKILKAYQQERDHKKLYLDDMVEFLLDPNLDRSTDWLADDLVYHINLLGYVKDDRGTAEGKPNADWNGHAVYEIEANGTINQDHDEDHGYVVEVALPWTELGLQPQPGTAIGFNFTNGDNDGIGRQLFDWQGAWPMRTPKQFGTLILEKAY
jgi:hypothetical protein